MSIKFLIIGLLILLLIQPVLSAPSSPLPGNQTVRISAETGENYIQWSFRLDNGSSVSIPVDIYIDDSSTPITTMYNRSSYLMLNLDPNERHNIAIYNNGTNLLGRGTTTTLQPSYGIYFLLGLCFVCMIIAFALQDIVKFVLLSIFNIILSLLGASFASGHGALPYVFIGISILTAIVLLVQGIPKLRAEIDWL